MTDFFSRLAGRNLGVTRVIQPHIRSRYAARVPGDADTEVVRGGWIEQSDEFPAETRPQDEQRRGLHARDALPQTDPGAATRIVAAGSVESEDAAVQDGREPVRAEPLPVASRAQMKAIEARVEVLGREAAPTAGAPAVPFVQGLVARQTEQPAEADMRVESDRQIQPAIAVRSQLVPPAHDHQQPPLDIHGATRRKHQETPSRVASPTLALGEPAQTRRAPGHLARDLELDAPPAPEIHVSIGRIEVRAMAPPTAQPPRARSPSAGPALSLEAYLQKRLEGSR